MEERACSHYHNINAPNYQKQKETGEGVSAFVSGKPSSRPSRAGGATAQHQTFQFWHFAFQVFPFA